VSGFSGDEGDAIAAAFYPAMNANGMQFSCLGEDNDMHPTAHCGGGLYGWWFNRCTRSLINLDFNGSWNAVDAALRPTYDVVCSRMLVKLD